MADWFEAIRAGDISTIQSLVDANLDRCTEDRKSGLHLAVENGHLEIVNLLMEHGSQMLCHEDAFGTEPIHVAAKMGSVSMLECLVEWFERQNPFPKPENSILSSDEEHFLFRSNDKGKTPIEIAVNRNDINLFRAIVRLGQKCEDKVLNQNPILPKWIQTNPRWRWRPEVGSWLNCRQLTGQPLLHVAAAKGHLEMISELLRHRCEIEAEDYYELTSLHRAAFNGQWQAIQLLVGMGGGQFLDQESMKGFTPINCALDKAEYDTVVVLQALGATEYTTYSLSEDEIEYLQSPIKVKSILKIRFRTFFRRSLVEQLIFWLD